jgi:hypothetical protein
VPLQLCLITENITTKPALTVVVAGAIVSLSVSSDKAQTLMLTLKGCMTKPTGSFATNVVISNCVLPSIEKSTRKGTLQNP